MILPNKHISPEFSLLGAGGELLARMADEDTVSSLWDRARDVPTVATFERYALALTLLYSLGAIGWEDGFIKRTAVP
jgi:hypothetical protein